MHLSHSSRRPQVPVQVLHPHRDVLTAGEDLPQPPSAAVWSSQNLTPCIRVLHSQFLHLTPPSLDHDHGYGASLGYFGFVLSSLPPEHPTLVVPGAVLHCPLLPACSFPSIRHMIVLCRPHAKLLLLSHRATDPYTPPPKTCSLHVHLHLHLSVASLFL